MIEDAKHDVELTQTRMETYYRWLQGETITGYKPRKKQTQASSAYQRGFSYARAFYSYNEIVFDREWSRSIEESRNKKDFDTEEIKSTIEEVSLKRTG